MSWPQATNKCLKGINMISSVFLKNLLSLQVLSIANLIRQVISSFTYEKITDIS